jgi:hypothetical protein
VPGFFLQPPPRFPPLGARATGPGAEGFAQTPLAPTYGRRSKGGGPGRQRFGPKGALGAQRGDRSDPSEYARGMLSVDQSNQ